VKYARTALVFVFSIAMLFGACAFDGCDSSTPPSDAKQHDAQETLLQEGVRQVGMPNIKNFREKKLMKDILEMRDQDGLITWTYLQSEMTGKLCFLGHTVGYGLPYATQFTNPQQAVGDNYHVMTTIAQADPNGLFSPESAEGTWVLMKDPNGTDTKPIYVEPRIVTSPFKLGDPEPCYPSSSH